MCLFPVAFLIAFRAPLPQISAARSGRREVARVIISGAAIDPQRRGRGVEPQPPAILQIDRDAGAARWVIEVRFRPKASPVLITEAHGALEFEDECIAITIPCCTD